MALEFDITDQDVDGTHQQRYESAGRSELEEGAEGDGITLRCANARRHQVRSRTHQRAVAAEARSERQRPRKIANVQIYASAL